MAFEELKQRQSVMWGTGPYQRITETIADIHEAVLEKLESGFNKVAATAAGAACQPLYDFAHAATLGAFRDSSGYVDATRGVGAGIATSGGV